MSDSDSEEDDFEQSSDKRVDKINDQSYLELLDQCEWCVDSVVDNEAIDKMHEDEPAYPELLDSISDINIE